jgi:hypothetical protein
MKKIFFALAIATLSSGLFHVEAQDRHMGPPPVLLIVREDIKPGKMPAHNKHSASYAQIFGRLQTNSYRIACVPVAGSENEVVYLSPMDTFAQLEQVQRETDKKMTAASGTTRTDLDRLEREAPDLHAGMRDMFAVYRPELSYDPDVDIAKMRYFAVTTVRLRPGQEDQYGEFLRNVINTARKNVKAELHIAAFQVIAGSPNTTYMFFRPMKSLSEYDLKIGPRVRAAMTEDQKKKSDKIAGEAVMVSETSIYAFAPQMSYVPKEMIAGDPTFWSPKTQEAATAKRPMKRKSAKSGTAPAANPQ